MGSREIEIDGLVVEFDPDYAIDLLDYYMFKQPFEIFSDNCVSIIGYYAYLSFYEAKYVLKDFFQNYALRKRGWYQNSLGSLEKMVTYNPSDISYIYSNEILLKIDNIRKKLNIKGMFNGNIDNLLDLCMQEDDQHLQVIAYNTFLYVSIKMNEILYKKNYKYKEFLDSIKVLRKQSLLGNVNEAYIDCLQCSHNKYPKIINKNLEKISNLRKLKISDKIKRNEYMAILDNRIKYVIKEYNLVNKEDFILT